jgi:predicted Ser/Thr protein kinase
MFTRAVTDRGRVRGTGHHRKGPGDAARAGRAPEGWPRVIPVVPLPGPWRSDGGSMPWANVPPRRAGVGFIMAQTVASPGAEDTRELRDAGCGRAVGRYTLLRRIAAGGMAEVYSARSRGEVGFAKRVAIKKILPQYSHNERFISMLLDEAKITVALDHPNIAQVHELGHDGEDYFIVMEYVDGRPLNKLMQRVDERGLNMIPVEHSCHIMSQVALGLHHAHSQLDLQGNTRNIVHRDVSPQNVLISYDGHVKLIDFGIARAEGRLNQTSAGVIKGKLRYLAPEIAGGAGARPAGRRLLLRHRALRDADG